MRMDKLTIKSREAIEASERIARSLEHGDIGTLHLLRALSEQGGIVTSLLERVGVRVPDLLAATARELGKKPKVRGADLPLSSELSQLLEASQKRARDMKDEYVSTEHFILAMAETRCEARGVLSELGVKFEALLQALVDVRGNQRVTSESPESTFEALKQYM